jgi:hypothetical protein
VQPGGHRPVDAQQRLRVAAEFPQDPVGLGLHLPAVADVGTARRGDRHQRLDDAAGRVGEVAAESQHVREPIGVAEDRDEDHFAAASPFLDGRGISGANRLVPIDVTIRLTATTTMTALTTSLPYRPAS